jgi:hypothetical protein
MSDETEIVAFAFKELKAQAVALAEFYKSANTFQSEHHGDILMPQGNVAKEFLERWKNEP